MRFRESADCFSDLQGMLKNQLQRATGEGGEFAEALLIGGLVHILEETKRKYRLLERRILDETQNDLEKYAIRTTIIDRQDYDPVNPTWFPVLEAELQPYLTHEEELWSALETKMSVCIRHIFVKAPDEECRNILRESHPLHGFVQTDQGEIPALFSLTKSDMYRSEISDLYKLFYTNKILWTTLNTAYLDKCLAVSLDCLQGVIPQGAHWRGVRIDYGPYSEIIDEHKIPLWNVQRFQYDGNAFPMPCLDSVNYEHEMLLEYQNKENGYLVEPCEEIADIRYELERDKEDSRIIVVSPNESVFHWNIRRIIPAVAKKSLGYDFSIISNKVKNRMRAKATASKQLRTKDELRLIMRNLDIDDFIQFTSCEFLEVKAPYSDLDDMNWFMRDEIFDRRNRRILQLNFHAVQPGHYLNDAMVRFVTSSVQLMVSEYRCIGILAGSNA